MSTTLFKELGPDTVFSKVKSSFQGDYDPETGRCTCGEIIHPGVPCSEINVTPDCFNDPEATYGGECYSKDCIHHLKNEPICGAFEMVETNWKTNIRVHDLELRSFNSLNNYTWDIVKWIKREGDSEFCIALAYWLINEKDPYDGSDLKFVGARPFADDVDQDTFMMLAKIGQNLVDKWNIGVNGKDWE